MTMTLSERYKMASILLSYPNDEFREALEEMAHVSDESQDSQLVAAVEGLRSVPWTELVRCYVATFDMQESTALYLTSHELGDSRERGGALLRLHALLQSAALEPIDGELPDYLPLLLEFLSERPDGMPTGDLQSRLAAVSAAISARLDEAHPYQGVFDYIRACLAEEVESDLPRAVVRPDSKPDLEDMPYPLVYD